MPGRAVGQLARLRLRERDELGQRLRLHRRIDDQHVRRLRGQCNRREVLDRIVRYLLVEHGIERQRARRHQEGVAVVRRARDALDTDHVAGAGAVLDEELLLERLGEMIRHHARDDVGAAGGRRGHDDAHGPVRPGLGLRLSGQDDSTDRNRQNNPKHGRLLPPLFPKFVCECVETYRTWPQPNFLSIAFVTAGRAATRLSHAAKFG